MSRMPRAIKLAESRIGMVTRGEMLSNSWPINQGKIIPPMPPPTRIQPTKSPVRVNRCSAKDIAVAKTEAIESPIRIVPPQRARDETGQTSKMAKAVRQPAKSINKMVWDRRREEMPIPSNLPTVKAPQKAEVKYAAPISLTRCRWAEKVKIQLPKPSSNPTMKMKKRTISRNGPKLSLPLDCSTILLRTFMLGRNQNHITTGSVRIENIQYAQLISFATRMTLAKMRGATKEPMP